MKKLILFALLLISCGGFAADWIDQHVPGEIIYTHPIYEPTPGDYIVTIPKIQASNITEQPLTADSPATEPSTTAEILRIVLIAIGSMLGFVLKNLIPLLNSLLKAHMHFRGSSVVADALTQALADMGAEVQKALADGVITAEEKAELKRRAKEIAKERLKNLSGFYKRDLMGWLDEALEVQLAKLLSRI